MAIRITQDPINNFFDNLPRYALDLKQQDDAAKFRDRQLSENIRQFNERQAQQQRQFADTMDLSRDRLNFDIDKAMRALDINQQNVDLTRMVTEEGMDERAFLRNRRNSEIALKDEIMKNLADVENQARNIERDSELF